MYPLNIYFDTIITRLNQIKGEKMLPGLDNFINMLDTVEDKELSEQDKEIKNDLKNLLDELRNVDKGDRSLNDILNDLNIIGTNAMRTANKYKEK